MRQDPDNLTRDALRWDLAVSLPDADSDGDGMPDAWEEAAFGSVDETADGDFDADGRSNLNEFLAGTDPADPASRFEIVEASVGPEPPSVTLSWSSVPGRRYRVMRTADLAEGSWQFVVEVPAEQAPATHTTRAFDVDGGLKRQFYRIEIAP